MPGRRHRLDISAGRDRDDRRTFSRVALEAVRTPLLGQASALLILRVRVPITIVEALSRECLVVDFDRSPIASDANRRW